MLDTTKKHVSLDELEIYNEQIKSFIKDNASGQNEILTTQEPTTQEVGDFFLLEY